MQGRNLNLCFTKIERPASPHSYIQEDPGRSSIGPGATDNIPSPIFFKNFNSLYDQSLDSITTTTTTTSHPSSPDADAETTTTPDFSTVIASNRFFFSSPGRSNSIIDSSPTSPSPSSSSLASSSIVGDSIAIPTYSPDPYADFRRSMQEMVEARDMIDVRADWDYLHELLKCYLSLNPKSTHKFIIGAFADLLVSLMSTSHRDCPSEK